MSAVRDFEGRVVAVTGGSRGIGRAIVLGAVERGARVILCCRTLGSESDATVEQAERIGGSGAAVAVAANVAREDEVDALVEQAVSRYGRLDAAIHSAGINRNQFLVHSSVDAFDEVIAVNLTGAFLLARAALREFLAAGEGGRIVFLGSISDRGGTAQSAYAASKGGLRGLARTLAKEYGHKKILTNVVVAGWVETELTAALPENVRKLLLAAPLRRSGTAAEIAAAALYLASPSLGFVNGETLYASGGLCEVNV